MTHTTNTEKRLCIWCGKREADSEWEQENWGEGWKRLCKSCARARLRNPYNALLSMRKIKAIEKGS